MNYSNQLPKYNPKTLSRLSLKYGIYVEYLEDNGFSIVQIYKN